jgi:hypothetical protein
MAAAPSAGPLIPLSARLWWRIPNGKRSPLVKPNHRAAGCLNYFFNFFQGKSDERN